MFIWIPPQVMCILTSPGIVVHEIAHQLFCDLFNVKVIKVCYLNFGSETGGYVVHERTHTFHISLLIGIAPLIVNSLLCMLLTFPQSVSMFYTLGNRFNYASSSGYYLATITLYALGLIIGMSAFPSDKDLQNPAELARTPAQTCLVAFLGVIAQFFNTPTLGVLLRIFFALLVSGILPALFLMIVS